MYEVLGPADDPQISAGCRPTDKPTRDHPSHSDKSAPTGPSRQTKPYPPSSLPTIQRNTLTYQALDEATFATVVEILRRARHDGIHPAEALHRSGLLLSPRVENGVKVATLEYVLHELRSWSPTEFLRRRDKRGIGATPEELHRCICEYIEDLISMARKETDV